MRDGLAAKFGESNVFMDVGFAREGKLREKIGRS
jgi:hypothetical protein